jgi:hypothetical protein
MQDLEDLVYGVRAVDPSTNVRPARFQLDYLSLR